MDANRDPCPFRIATDAGGAFSIGIIGGSMVQFFIGVKNGKGFYGKWNTAMRNVYRNGSRHGGSFAMWGATFSTIDCGLVAVRQKEDPINSIVAGAATGGILALRSGPQAVLIQSIIGGSFLAIIEGMGILMQRFAAPMMEEVQTTPQ